MIMDKRDRKALLRTAILLQLQASYPASLSMETIECGLRIGGHSTNGIELDREVEYMRDKNLLSVIEHELSVSHKRIKLTHIGLEHLEREGF